MESSTTSGLSFGGLGFGSKPVDNKENKPNVFGGSAFGSQQQETPKPVFGSSAQTSGFIKTPTFTFQNTGTPAASQPAPAFGGQSAFGASANQSGNLFNSFVTSPQKPAFGQPAFGAQPVFGASNAFGGAPTSPGTVFGSSAATTSTFGAASANKPLFGAAADSGSGGGNLFGMLAQQSGQAQQQQPSLFGSFCKFFYFCFL